MSEGGIYPWKVQKIKRPPNGILTTCSYTDLSRSLPDPPKDKVWIQDGITREWRLVPIVEASVVPTVSENESCAVAEVDHNESIQGSESEICVAVPIVPSSMDASVEKPQLTQVDEVSNGSELFIHHEVQPFDTFQGICLRYKVTPTDLRRANNMMGTNLHLAPKTLLIPNKGHGSNGDSENSLRKYHDKARKESTKEEKITTFLDTVTKRLRHLSSSSIAESNNLSLSLEYSDARAYLELNDWDIAQAVDHALEDLGWCLQQS